VSWSELGDWWLSEVAGDPAYESVITPLLLEVLRPESGLTYLDLGCGEGRVMRTLHEHGAITHGVDVSFALARRAGTAVVADLRRLPLRDDSYDAAYSALTLEHVAEHWLFFSETARVVRSTGVLALVINHPVWTAPDSTPISDSDGEVLWRPGDYFGTGQSQVGDVVFHHRSMADLLNAAAEAGWRLEEMVEQPHHEIEDQSGIPRLLACRWRLS
jgi:SAM-dependent methyltransferase